MHVKEETIRVATMPRSFLVKKNNYSHCPLKKRPVYFVKDESEYDADSASDHSEPENLSTKPQDLSLAGKTGSSGVTLMSMKALTGESCGVLGAMSGAPCYPSLPSAAPAHAPATPSSKTCGGPLEPLNLNTPMEMKRTLSPLKYREAPPPPPHSPPHSAFNPYSGNKEVYPHYYSALSPSKPCYEQPISPYTRERSPSKSPSYGFSPFRPVPTIPVKRELDSRLYVPYPYAESLSPVSPTWSSHSLFQSHFPPPATPEDLSSPGSVASSGESSSSGSTSCGKKRSKEGSNPRYKCVFCNKSYSTYSGLSKHQQFHCAANEDSSAKKTFSCKYCEKIYFSLGALKMHIRTHTLPCKCKLCGKAFSRPWLLQGHIRTHTGEKPFSCQHCNRAFADRSNLRAHLQTHSDVKKYSCPTCSKTFSRMSLLSKHTDGGCAGTGSVHSDDLHAFQSLPRPVPTLAIAS
nr:PREDICTED: protein snail homolog Sna-like [Bemisia tabaci]